MTNFIRAMGEILRAMVEILFVRPEHPLAVITAVKWMILLILGIVFYVFIVYPFPTLIN
jgi:hypothetical protein